MNTPSGYNSCEQAKSHFTLYSLRHAALLWCGVPAHQVNDHLEKAIEVIPGVFSLSYISCLEPRCRLINDAIDRGVLPVCREKGYVVDDHVAPARRHLRGQDLREWIAKEHPNDKPAFLFDEIERKAHSSIDKNVFIALQADRDAARAELDRLKVRIKETTEERDNLLMEASALKACIEKMIPVAIEPGNISETERNSMLKLIIGMAIDAYGYDPESNRNSATGDKNGISAKIKTRGISLGDDTIRDFLKEAKNLYIAPKVLY